MLKALAVIILFASSAEAATSRQFNLDCTGEKSRDDTKQPGQIIKEPWQGIYSVDLDARAWCTRPACHAYKLDHARGDDIALRTENPPIDHPSEAVDILFDAKRMHLEEQHWHFEATYFVDAACKYAPFERLPEGPLEYPTKGQE